MYKPLMINREELIINLWIIYSYRGVFKGPYHFSCRVLNFRLPTVGCWKLKNLYCVTQNVAYFLSKQTDSLSIQDNFVQNPKFLTGNWHESCKSRVVICNMNTTLYSCMESFKYKQNVWLWFSWFGSFVGTIYLE